MISKETKAEAKEHRRLMKKALTVPWKVSRCGTKNCWCAPIIPIFTDEKGYDVDMVAIAHSGSVPKEFAKHIVELHNKSLK